MPFDERWTRCEPGVSAYCRVTKHRCAPLRMSHALVIIWSLAENRVQLPLQCPPGTQPVSSYASQPPRAAHCDLQKERLPGAPVTAAIDGKGSDCLLYLLRRRKRADAPTDLRGVSPQPWTPAPPPARQQPLPLRRNAEERELILLSACRCGV